MFDLQVNGYGGVDFNQDDLQAEALRRACERLAADGVEGILATIITEQLDLMVRRIARVVELRGRDPLVGKMIAGVHVEGPFLSPEVGYRGAHPADAIVPGDIDAMEQLLEAGGGLVRLVTLAPECDAGLKVCRHLSKRGILVSAGHTNASYDRLRAACLEGGVSLFTHLGNGCPMQMHRHDNIIQRALALRELLRFGFIADGAHVPFFALGNCIRLAGVERCFVVTDAIAPAGLGPGRYSLGRWDLQIGEDMVARSPDGSHLVGSAGTMKQSVRNLVERVGMTEEEAKRLTGGNPREIVGTGRGQC